MFKRVSSRAQREDDIMPQQRRMRCSACGKAKDNFSRDMIFKATASTRVCMDCEKGAASVSVAPQTRSMGTAEVQNPPAEVMAQAPPTPEAVAVREPVPEFVQNEHGDAPTPAEYADESGDPFAPPPSDPSSVPAEAWPGGCFIPRGEDPAQAPQLTFDPSRKNWAHFTDGVRKELMGTYTERDEGAYAEIHWLNLRKWEGEDEQQMNGYDYKIDDVETIEISTDGKAFLRGQDFAEEWIWGAEP